MTTPLTPIPARHADLTGTLPVAALPTSGVTPATLGVLTAGEVDQYGRLTSASSDSRFSWDAANLRHTLTGQAASAGGDRWRLQNPSGLALARWDADGALQQDMAVNASGFISRVSPQSDGPPFTFNHAIGTFNNDPGAPGGNGYNNAVWQAGWNTNMGGAQVDSTWPTFRIAMESNYNSGAGILMEGHAFAFRRPGVSGEVRPMSMYIDKTNGYAVNTIFNGDVWTWTNKNQAKSVMSAMFDEPTRLQQFTLYGDDVSSNGYAFQVTSNGATPQDFLNIGRNTSLNTQFTVTGLTSTRLDLKSTVSGTLKQATLLNNGDFALIGPSGGNVWHRTFGYWSVTNGNQTQNYIQIDSNGGTGLGLGGTARNVGLGGVSWADGVGVVAIRNCVTPPALNSTNGGILYAEAGALKWRGSSGTVTTLASA